MAATAAAAAAAAAVATPQQQQHVVVCGGGIIGASTAYHLSKRGLKTTVVEAVAPACSASGKAGWAIGTTVAFGCIHGSACRHCPHTSPPLPLPPTPQTCRRLPGAGLVRRLAAGGAGAAVLRSARRAGGGAGCGLRVPTHAHPQRQREAAAEVDGRCVWE